MSDGDLFNRMLANRHSYSVTKPIERTKEKEEEGELKLTEADKQFLKDLKVTA